MLSNATQMSVYLFKELEALKKKLKNIKEVRGLGLMCGIELTIPGKAVVEKCINRGLLINCTHETVLRLMPALNVTKRQIDFVMRILAEVLNES